MTALRIEARDGAARTGILHTAHGDVRTPAFMPVGTHATVRACTPQEVTDTGADILLCNGYHLILRPGVDLVERAGGLHAGATFVSPFDGTRMRMTPEQAVADQARLGADIVMCLDHPVAYGTDLTTTQLATDRTHRWAERCRAHHPGEGHLLFGITQGGFDPHLRAESARAIAALDFDGVAIGGLALGEPPPVMQRMAEAALECIPETTPRYVMGLGTDAELLAMVAVGIDMFDCVLPTRLARNGTALTAGGRLSLRRAQFRDDLRTLEPGCPCPSCSGGFTRAYLRHLFRAGEILAHRLLSLHNLTHLGTLMGRAREAIAAGSFADLRAAALDGLAGGVDSDRAGLSPVGYSSRP